MFQIILHDEDGVGHYDEEQRAFLYDAYGTFYKTKEQAQKVLDSMENTKYVHII